MHFDFIIRALAYKKSDNEIGIFEYDDSAAITKEELINYLYTHYSSLPPARMYGSILNIMNFLDEYFLYSDIDISEIKYNFPEKAVILNTLKFITSVNKKHRSQLMRENIKNSLKKVHEVINQNKTIAIYDIGNLHQPEISKMMKLLRNYSKAKINTRIDYFTETNNFGKLQITIFDSDFQKNLMLNNIENVITFGSHFYIRHSLDIRNHLININESLGHFTSLMDNKKRENFSDYCKYEVNKHFQHFTSERAPNLIEFINNYHFLSDSCDTKSIANILDLPYNTKVYIDIQNLNFQSFAPEILLKDLKMPHRNIKIQNFLHEMKALSCRHDVEICLTSETYEKFSFIMDYIKFHANTKINHNTLNISSNNYTIDVDEKIQIKANFPQYLSPSSLQLLNKNPFSFYLSKCLKINFIDRYYDDTHIKDFGSFVHKIAEEFEKYTHSKRRIDRIYLEKIVKNIAADYKIDLKDMLIDFRVKNICNTLIEIEEKALKNKANVQSEVIVNIPLSDGIRIYGVCDRIETIGNEKYFYDFKTGDLKKYNETSELNGKKTQLSIYGMNESNKSMIYCSLNGFTSDQNIIQDKDCSISDFVCEQINNVLKFYKENPFGYKMIANSEYEICQQNIFCDLFVRKKHVL